MFMGKFSAMSPYNLTMPHNVDSAHFGLFPKKKKKKLLRAES